MGLWYPVILYETQMQTSEDCLRCLTMYDLSGSIPFHQNHGTYGVVRDPELERHYWERQAYPNRTGPSPTGTWQGQRSEKKKNVGATSSGTGTKKALKG